MCLQLKFESLLCHLNAEDNDMALELLDHIKEADVRLEKLDALEAGGVDNWGGYGDCFEDDDDE